MVFCPQSRKVQKYDIVLQGNEKVTMVRLKLEEAQKTTWFLWKYFFEDLALWWLKQKNQKKKKNLV